ncbi:MAG: MBOAT family O-acyltransferase [Vicinamibacterales bacterium]
MIFHSLDFVVFFLLTTAAYWRLPRRGQNALLVVCSYVFYGWVHPWFLLLIGATTIADYAAARGMEAWPRHRKTMLGLSLAVNLGLLGAFKYFGFFVDNAHTALALFGIELPRGALSVLLPVGISFYTFQELSYTIEVYRGTLRARRDFIDFAAFVSFYPQLVAGPIERASHLLPQVEQRRVWSWPASREALFLIAWGYFKKLVIADNVGLVANKVFSLDHPGFTVLWSGVFAFAVQIYADFSAYSDIARGVARWLGFDLMLNFNHPYMATGPIDFWRRWHISLSSWFRDYVYVPLGGSRGGRWRTARNVFVTFIVSGFWHGASWNYILWGAYHGVLLLAARAIASVTSRTEAGTAARRSGHTPGRRHISAIELLQVAGTFVLTCVGWLLFRETDLHALIRDLTLSPFDTTLADRQVGLYLFVLTLLYAWPLLVDGFWAVYVAPALREKNATRPAIGAVVAVRTLLAGLALAAIVVFRSQQSLDFIYFQF